MRVIRVARHEDFPALCGLYDQVDSFHRESLPHIFRDTPDPPRSREFIQGLMDGEESEILVAEGPGGALLGCVEVVDFAPPARPMTQPRRYAVVEELVVDAAQRGQGLGRLLMDAAHEWARGRGLKSVQLHVWEFNSGARGFYEELGYETLSRRLRYEL